MPYTSKEQYEEVGKELIQLGYERLNDPTIGAGDICIVTNIGNRNQHFGSILKTDINKNQSMILSDKDSYELNKELFLALASLRDDTKYRRGDMVTDDDGNNIYKYDRFNGTSHYPQVWGFYNGSEAKITDNGISFGGKLRKATKEEIIKRVTEMFGNPCKAIPLGDAQPGGSVVGPISSTKGSPGRKIIGYKAPYSLFSGKVERGTIYKPISSSNITTYCATKNGNIIDEGKTNLPREIVELWEPAYEEVKIKIAGYEAEFLSNERVKFGCQSFTKGEVNILATILFNKDISAKLTILGEEVSYDTLRRIYLKM